MEANASVARVATNVHRAVDKAADIATPAADWIATKADVLREAPQKIAREGRDIVSSHPWKAVGAAVLLGLLISRMLR